MPTISVIIPAYNAEKYIAQTIDSVKAQTMPDWELIVVDDGSRDGTAQIVQKYVSDDPRIRLVRQANGGVAAARNHGASLADPASEYLIFLDSDDVWTSNALCELKSALEEDTGAVAAHGQAYAIDSQGQEVSSDFMRPYTVDRRSIVAGEVVPWPVDRPVTFAALCLQSCIVTPGLMLIRKTFVDAVGGFDKVAGTCADWDMWIRLSRNGRIMSLNNVILGYRQHPHNMSKNGQATRKANMYVHRKRTRSSENDCEHRKTAEAAKNHHRSGQMHGFRMQVSLA